MSSYYEFKVETLEEAIEYCEAYQQLRPGVVFRGQANAVWELTANAFRGNAGPEEVEGRFRKTDAFCKWWRTRPATPPFDDAQLWQVAQHYGMNTDLLDFTESVYVAAFFACGQPRIQVQGLFQRAALFVIDPADFENIHNLSGLPKELQSVVQRYTEIWWANKIPGLLRQEAQRSCFLRDPNEYDQRSSTRVPAFVSCFSDRLEIGIPFFGGCQKSSAARSQVDFALCSVCDR